MRYQHYAAKWMLPTRRLQMQMAQIAHVSAQVAGNKAQLSDFLFDPVDEEIEPEDAAEFFGFNPRKKS